MRPSTAEPSARHSPCVITARKNVGAKIATHSTAKSPPRSVSVKAGKKMRVTKGAL